MTAARARAAGAAAAVAAHWHLDTGIRVRGIIVMLYPSHPRPVEPCVGRAGSINAYDWQPLSHESVAVPPGLPRGPAGRRKLEPCLGRPTHYAGNLPF